MKPGTQSIAIFLPSLGEGGAQRVAIDLANSISSLGYQVDIVLASLMIIGGVVGAQIGARLGAKLRGEELRGILAIIVLIVCIKIILDLTLTPKELYSLSF